MPKRKCGFIKFNFLRQGDSIWHISMRTLRHLPVKRLGKTFKLTNIVP